MTGPEHLLTGKNGDKEFIQEPDMWPNWPYCPMKKRDEKEHYPSRFGLLVETGEAFWQSTVYLDRNLYSPQGKLSEAEKKVYASIDEMLADGWSVD